MWIFAILNIEYTRPYLYPKQLAATFPQGKRWALCEASTKSGKTVAAITRIIEAALAGQPGQNFWWVAPVSNQARIAFNRVKQNLTEGVFKPYEHPETYGRLVNGTAIWFKSADNPDCFDDKTEILTSKGWKLFANLDKSEDVLTLNPKTLVAEWNKPYRYIDAPYNGEMYRISSGKLDQLVTPNHRLFVKTRKTEVPRGRPVVENLKYKLSAARQAERLRRIQELEVYKENFSSYEFKHIRDVNLNDKIPAKSGWVGSDLDWASHDICALLGIYLSEGCSSGAFGGVSALANGDYIVHFSQTEGSKGGVKGNVRQQMRELFQRLGLQSVKETEDGFFIRNKALWEKFSKLGNCYNKFVPDRIKELPPQKLETLIHWMLLGDGTIRYSDTSTETVERVYYTTSRQLADDFQEIVIKSGLSAILRIKNKAGAVSKFADGRDITASVDCYSVSIVNSDFNYLQDSQESYISTEYYDGRVYCVETENSTVLVRRNGKVCWSGNSLYGEDVFGAVMDEASRSKAEAWHAVRSTLTATRGWGLLIGNVKGRKNWFYEWCRRVEAGKDPNASFTRIGWRDAVAAGVLDAEEIEDARRNLPEAVFRELYEAYGSDDGGNPFGLDHIAACIVEKMSTGKPIAWGIDLAKKQDYYVVIGLDEGGNVCCFDRWNGLAWGESIRRTHALVGEDSPTLVDSTGLGDPVLEQLQIDHSNISGYNFSNISKQRLMEGLAVSIQRHEMTFPKGHISDELESFEYDVHGSRTFYSAPDGYNDDCVCALALARQAWMQTAPGQNMMDYYAQTLERQKAIADIWIPKPDNRPWQHIKPEPTFEDMLGNELTQVYEEIVKKSLSGPNINCQTCGYPVSGSERVTDGEFFWHRHCIGFH